MHVCQIYVYLRVILLVHVHTYLSTYVRINVDINCLNSLFSLYIAVLLQNCDSLIVILGKCSLNLLYFHTGLDVFAIKKCLCFALMLKLLKVYSRNIIFL